MFRGLYCDQPESLVIQAAELPALGANQVRIKTTFAAIKHGTLFHLFSGRSPFQDRRFDRELRMFVPRDEVDQNVGLVNQFVGDMAVGTVVETGAAVTNVVLGDRVYCYGPVCDLLTRAADQVRPLPAAMSEHDAVCTDPAFFALGAVRDARASVGDNVVVFGLGAIGLFVVQLLGLAGCGHVIAVDPIAKRRALAERLGAQLALDPATADVGRAVRDQLGQGADIAIEASGNYTALQGAMRAVQQCARIVTLGYYKGGGGALELGAEWHHNRLELISSMPVWGNPSREHPLWDEERLARTVRDLLVAGRLTSEGIVDPVVPFEAAAQAFLDIYRRPEQAIKLGVTFP